ncbi:uncharacterized protein B0I36DRAFT_341940 [Microdochium trichocladiopsis]|uniref:Uncharacterized protein n=1 Tax=Microdochium trichocladiopsis TaxID=1682393 RepID=A0A9P8XRW8_9PEZI|nr:uncharacterized protein B0I36DRAFT_341940 [Microdochium trichocladiopsis]KAH7010670.1 hypothetical protein B0I36DRAFT_341940 [Microdochium trichocladiopsis]
MRGEICRSRVPRPHRRQGETTREDSRTPAKQRSAGRAGGIGVIVTQAQAAEGSYRSSVSLA